jgi:hypothetical protein
MLAELNLLFTRNIFLGSQNAITISYTNKCNVGNILNLLELSMNLLRWKGFFILKKVLFIAKLEKKLKLLL